MKRSVNSTKSLSNPVKVNFAALVALVLALSLSGYFLVHRTLAGTATLYVQPASASITQGATFSVSVRVNSGSDNTNVVQANLTYPADKLQLINIDSAGSAYDSTAQSTVGSGVIKIGRFSSAGSSVSGDQLVTNLNFKALGSSGQALVTFDTGSAVYSASDSSNILAGTNNGTYSLRAAQSAPLPAASTPAATPPPVATGTAKSPAVNSKTVAQAVPKSISVPTTQVPSLSSSTESPNPSINSNPVPTRTNNQIIQAAPAFQLAGVLKTAVIGIALLFFLCLIAFGMVKLTQHFDDSSTAPTPAQGMKPTIIYPNIQASQSDTSISPAEILQAAPAVFESSALPAIIHPHEQFKGGVSVAAMLVIATAGIALVSGSRAISRQTSAKCQYSQNPTVSSTATSSYKSACLQPTTLPR